MTNAENSVSNLNFALCGRMDTLNGMNCHSTLHSGDIFLFPVFQQGEESECRSLPQRTHQGSTGDRSFYSQTTPGP